LVGFYDASHAFINDSVVHCPSLGLYNTTLGLTTIDQFPLTHLR